MSCILFMYVSKTMLISNSRYGRCGDGTESDTWWTCGVAVKNLVSYDVLHAKEADQFLYKGDVCTKGRLLPIVR